MRSEQLEIAQLKREVIRLKAEREILKKGAAALPLRADAKVARRRGS
jgi:hypothetical protein